MIDVAHDGHAATPQPALAELERQVERGNLFTHTALSENAERIGEVEAFLYGLVDVLVGQGVATADEVGAAAARARHEIEVAGESAAPGVMLRLDAPEAAKRPAAKVNCAERLHICKAVCCKLTFALSPAEVEEGAVRWDLGQPYIIRQKKCGYCTHNDPEKHGCRLYENRPAVCRVYSCADDQRIWKDFERMVLNEEWLGANIGESVPRLVRASMQLRDQVASSACHTAPSAADPR